MKGCKDKMGKYNKNYNYSNDEFAKDMEAPIAEENVVAEAEVEEAAPVVEEPKPEPKKEAPKKAEEKTEPKKEIKGPVRN